VESLDYDQQLDILKHHADHTADEVIAAIDSLYANMKNLKLLQRASVGDLMQELKWSDHYSHQIQDGDDALRTNASFYADFVLWVGWQAAKEAREQGTWAETTHAQLRHEQGDSE
jgi:hypothetical protein